MKFRTVFAVMMVLALGYAPSAKADPVISEGCRIVGGFVGAALGYGITKGLSGWITAGATGVGGPLGAEQLGSRCENYFNSWQRQTGFDYEKFVREVCNGNPYTCPNGWNSMGGVPGSPVDCSTYIVCSFAFALQPNGSVSIQDLINAATFVDLSYRVGFWDFDNFGHLVGVPGVSFDPR